MDLIKPTELENDDLDWTGRVKNSDTWRTLSAAREGDLAALKDLVTREPNLAQCEYWYTTPLHFAVREGHLDCVRFLIEHGADITERTLVGEYTLVQVAQDRNHDDTANYIESVTAELINSAVTDHLIHRASKDGDIDEVGRLIRSNKDLVNLGDSVGRRPLHYAVEQHNIALIKRLLELGATVDAPGFSADNRLGGFGFRPIVSALWHHPYWKQRNDFDTVELLLSHGADYSMTIAAARGDKQRVLELLRVNKDLANHQEQGGKRAISAATERGHIEIVELLLDAGCDPNLEEGPNCPRGFALWSASRNGNLALAERLLAAGADPNAMVESSGNPTESAINQEMRNLLYEHGGRVGVTQIFHENNTDVVAAMLAVSPEKFNDDVLAQGFTMSVSSGHKTLVRMLLNAGFRVPSMVTGCQTYLWHNLKLAEELLTHGMDPNLPNWQRMTPLHHMAQKGLVKEAELFIKHGASPSLVDEEFCSTPLGWAARAGQTDFVRLLLDKFPDRSLREPKEVPDWATPLAWASKRRHSEIVVILNDGA